MADEEVIRRFLVEIGYKNDSVSQQRALASVEMMTGVLGKLAGAVAVAFGVGKVIQFNDALAKTAAQADKLGTTVQGLERLGKAAEIGGGSIAGLQSAMRGFADFIKNAPGSGQWLERWLPGVTRDAETGKLKDATGKVVDQLEAMKRFITELNKSPGFDLATKLTIAKTAGVGADEYFALTNKSVQELEASLKRIDDTFLGDPSTYIENARKFKTEFDQLTRTLSDLYTRLLGEESGALAGPLKELNDFLQSHGNEIVKTVDTIAEAFKIVGGDIAEISHDIAAANSALQGFAKTVAETIAPITNTLHGVGGIGTKEGPARWLKHGFEELFGVSSAHAEGVAGDDLKAQQRADTVIKNTDALKALTEKFDKMASELARAFESRTQQEHEAAGMGMGGSSGAGASGGTSPSSGGGGSTPPVPDDGTGRGATKGSARTGEMMQYAMDQLRKEGVPEGNLRAAAANLVGQAQMESGLNPNLVHDQGTGYGIYGARLGRRDKMFNWLHANGYARNSAEGQMRYMAHEAMSGSYPQTRHALMSGAYGAGTTNAITSEFESPRVVNARHGAVAGAFNRGAEKPVGSGANLDDEKRASKARDDFAKRLNHGGPLADPALGKRSSLDWHKAARNAEMHVAMMNGGGTVRPLGDNIRNYTTDSHARTQNVNFGPFTTQVHLTPGGQQPSASAIAVGVESGMKKHINTIADNIAPMTS